MNTWILLLRLLNHRLTHSTFASTYSFLLDRFQDTLQIPVVITKTGVKHLHHAALQFDIGIYFEANGHGTVLFSEQYHEIASGQNTILAHLPQLINPAVGDALSDLLLVDLLLRHFDWTLPEWATQKLYQDLPSRQLKVKVQDRSRIVCNDNETVAVAPDALQPALDKAMGSMGDTARCFVRPSGTENVVRIYAEASTRALADQLATQAAQIVHETCQGVGPLPKI
jgi:phosphoacetylglucosamine mutase